MIRHKAYLHLASFLLVFVLASPAGAGEKKSAVGKCVARHLPIVSPIAEKFSQRILDSIAAAEHTAPVREAAFLSAEDARRELRKAEVKPIADFFPNLIKEINSREALPPIADPESLEATAERLQSYAKPRIEEPTPIPSDEMQPFLDEFSRILALQRSKYEGTIGTRAFKRWARNEVSRYASKDQMERILRNGDNFRSFLRLELGDKYELLNGDQNSWWQRVVVSRARHPWVKAVVRNPYIAVGGSFAVGSLATFWRVIKNAMAVGTLPLYVNAYTNPIQQPVLQIVGQKGIEHTAFIAVPEQKWLIDVNFAKMFVSHLKALVSVGNFTSLKGKPPEEAEAQLKSKLEEMHKVAQPLRDFMDKDNENYQAMLKLGIELQTRASGFLPGNQAGGRGQVWNALIFWPTDISTRLISVDAALTSHEHFEFDMQNKLEELNKDPKKNAAAIKALQQRIDQENKRIAAVTQEGASIVAVWMFNEFVFPEYTKKWVSESDEQALTRVYDFMKKNLQFDYFLDRFGPEANKVLDGIQEEIVLRELGVSAQVAKRQLQQDPTGAMKP